jgi:uncharacterized protein (TIGR02145 family)
MVCDFKFKTHRFLLCTYKLMFISIQYNMRFIFFKIFTLYSILSFSQINEKNDTKEDEVIIGSQVWMSKNLDVVKFRNGDLIPEAKTEMEWRAFAEAGEAAWCYDEKKSSRLYNWYAVNDPRGLAPKGWKVPSQNDWDKLITFLGGKNSSSKMKSKSGWKKEHNGTNSSGFNALPFGKNDSIGFLINYTEGAYWWTSSTEDKSEDAFTVCIEYDRGGFFGNWDRGFGLSVRCLKK